MATSAHTLHHVRLREFKREIDTANGAPPHAVPPPFFTPSLRELCTKAVAENFDRLPHVDTLHDVDEELYALIIDQLRTDLRLDVAVPRVRSPLYWKARCEARWSVGQLTAISDTGSLRPPAVGGWRRLFLERHIEEYLMGFTAETLTEEQEADATALLTLCAAEVRSLRLTHMQSRVDMSDLCGRLPHLERLSLTYSVVNVHTNFTPSMIGLRRADALAVQRLLRTCPQVRELHLPCNRIDSSMLRAVVAGLVRNNTVRVLGLEHNDIGDDGVGALSLLLMKPECAIVALNLADNKVADEGGAALGKALATNVSLTSLNLRLNRIEDGGGAALFYDSLHRNTTLQNLNLDANDVGVETIRALLSATQANPHLALRSISLCNNVHIGDAGGKMLLEAVRVCTSLVHVDSRESDVSQEEKMATRRLLEERAVQQRNRELHDKEEAMRKDIALLVSDTMRRTHGVHI